MRNGNSTMPATEAVNGVSQNGSVPMKPKVDEAPGKQNRVISDSEHFKMMIISFQYGSLQINTLMEGLPNYGKFMLGTKILGLNTIGIFSWICSKRIIAKVSWT